MVASSCVWSAVVLSSLASAQSIAQINGNRYISPYRGQAVTGVTGVITGIATTGSKGLFIRSKNPDSDPATSESIFVYGSSLVSSGYAVGDLISLNGNVNEYRSTSTYLYLTEITSASNIQTISRNNTVPPVVLGGQTKGIIGTRSVAPPTTLYSSLDGGSVFNTPSNTSLVSVANPTLNPSMYGMDFWESLSGEYVQINKPIVLDQPNTYGDTWVYGNWKVTGKNSRGGLTITASDGNPEAILIQDPLDGTSNPQTSKLGDQLDTITGVITTAYGYYTIRPDTAISIQTPKTPQRTNPTKLVQTTGSNSCKGLTLSDYNVENFNSTEDCSALGKQIVNFLRNPTILFLQEIQDNSGSVDNGVVNANQTLDNLVDCIMTAGGPMYSYTEVDPLDDTTGGEPGGNIRNAYLYNSKYVSLVSPNPGNATQSQVVLPGPNLKYNPGLIDPNNLAFNDSRRPLTAQWKMVNGGQQFFTVNVHSTSKGGSTSLFGDDRPPVNLGVTQRDAESNVTAAFVQQILAQDSNARIIAAGDWNEFRWLAPLTDFASNSGLNDVDTIINTNPVERYTYLFQQSSQALIHVYLSPQAAKTLPKLDRVHVNTWAEIADRVSDHDPDVVQINVC